MKANIKVNNNLICNLSKLAKLKFDKKATEEMKEDLKIIIGFINSISNMDTEGIEPLIYISEEVNVLSVDNISNNISQQDALNNAPHKDSDYFKVPTILNK